MVFGNNAAGDVSVVVTVKNDDEGVRLLKNALAKQTKQPAEVVVVRAEDHNNCSRAHGRNIGIKNARYSTIAVTDVGCTPRPDWLERLTAPIIEGRANVSAGFYLVIYTTPFQDAIAPFLAVMPNQWNSSYIPASRSIAFTKSAWELIGGYPEQANAAAEDIVFAHRLMNSKQLRTVQVPEALVEWEPPRSIVSYVGSIYSHTIGNFQVKYKKHMRRNWLVLTRWLIFLVFPILFFPYLLWPIIKHARHVHSPAAIVLLPFVQLMTDAAVLVALLRFFTKKI